MRSDDIDINYRTSLIFSFSFSVVIIGGVDCGEQRDEVCDGGDEAEEESAANIGGGVFVVDDAAGADEECEDERDAGEDPDELGVGGREFSGAPREVEEEEGGGAQGCAGVPRGPSLKTILQIIGVARGVAERERVDHLGRVLKWGNRSLPEAAREEIRAGFGNIDLQESSDGSCEDVDHDEAKTHSNRSIQGLRRIGISADKILDTENHDGKYRSK